MSDLEVASAELLAAAGPLREAARVLGALVADRAGMERFAEGSPSPVLREALGRFLARWGQLNWELSGDADWLAQALCLAAQTYTDADRSLSRGLLR